MVEELSLIKEQLFDAPAEVKEAFNNVVNYFSSDWEILNTKYGSSVFTGTKEECEKEFKSKDKYKNFLDETHKVPLYIIQRKGAE